MSRWLSKSQCKNISGKNDCFCHAKMKKTSQRNIRSSIEARCGWLNRWTRPRCLAVLWNHRTLPSSELHIWWHWRKRCLDDDTSLLRQGLLCLNISRNWIETKIYWEIKWQDRKEAGIQFGRDCKQIVEAVTDTYLNGQRTRRRAGASYLVCLQKIFHDPDQSTNCLSLQERMKRLQVLL